MRRIVSVIFLISTRGVKKMKMKINFLCLLVGSLLILSPSLFAVDSTRVDRLPNVDNGNLDQPQDILPGPVPEELVVNFNGLDWVWASPCNGGCSTPEPTNQEGWRHATDQELQNAPACSAFVRQDGSIRCASGYFDPNFPNTCNLGDCNGGWVSSINVVETATTARFHVTKTFTDGSTDDVQVMLTCDDGLPLNSNATISGGGDGVTFVVNDFEDGSMNCEVTESGGPSGYTPIFNDGDGCAFTNVSSGQYECVISNVPMDATFTANMEWSLINESGDEIDEDVEVTISCNAAITDSNGIIGSCGLGCFTATKTIGDGESLWVEASTLLGPVECFAEQGDLPSGVESSDNCGDRDIAAGASSSCTFTNTLFFEGVPTLNQYGMALMALLMLGVGFVGFRRFA
jgi:hypothetical protein